MKRALALLAFALLTAAAGAARAEDKAEALILKGIDLRRTGDDQGAYPLFVEAYELSHSPRSAGQRGLCEQALGRWADAETHVTEALKAPGDPWVKKTRAVLEQSLVVIKSHIARIDVVGEPPGAEVLVNGVVAGRLPLTSPVRVAAGEIEIELRANGYARASKSVRVDGGQYQRIVLRAEAEKAAPPPVATLSSSSSSSPSSSPSSSSSAVAPASSAPSPAASVTVVSPPPAAGAEPGSFRSAQKWIAWGVAAASLGVGIYGTARQLGAGSDFDAGCGLDSMGVPRPRPGSSNSEAQCAGFRDSVDSGFRLEVIGFVGAAVLGGVGALLWLTEPAGGATAEGGGHAALACAPSLRAGGGPWLGCALRF